jgi:uncharacterized protein YegJ (DUF2314 family)
MQYLIVGLVLAAIGCWLFLRYRRRKTNGDRMVSLVALLAEPQFVDAGVVARAAREAWGADLGDGQSEEEGPDGFVVGGEDVPTIALRYDERMILIHRFAQPYVENPEEAAEQSADMRIRSALAGHRAWMSCDALGVDESTTPEETEEWYRLLGSLLAELVDDNTLAIFVPQTSRLYPYNSTTVECLQSNKPLAALQQELDVPVIVVADDDPRMLAAVEEARTRWPEFQSAFESGRGESFAVKAPVTRGDNTEFIWLEVTAIENDTIYGELANDPVDLGDLVLGSKVSVPVSELNDWCYVDPQEQMCGGFTVKVVTEAAKERAGD